MSSAAPAALVEAVVALAKARAAATAATSAVNGLHKKHQFALPATEDDRRTIVTDLDACYLAAIKCVQQERCAALLCLRTMEELAKQEGGSGRFSAGRPSDDADAADEDHEQEPGSLSPPPSAMGGARPMGAPASSPHPYGSAPGWGAGAASDVESSAAGGEFGDEGDEGEDRASHDEGEEGGEEGEEGEEAASEMAPSEMASEMGDDDEEEEDYVGSEIGDTMNVAGSEIDDEEEVDGEEQEDGGEDGEGDEEGEEGDYAFEEGGEEGGEGGEDDGDEPAELPDE